MFLHSLETIDVFQQAIPKLPMGKYAHVIMLRETNSFALFQTDCELNISRVSLGRKAENQSLATRIVLFKRKQSTPERLTGRELLRRYGLVEDCKYNTKDFCKRCPDCIYYGFAIGNEGSERSKVLVDSAFSITGYDMSHQQFTFNAPSENGTMSEDGEIFSNLELTQAIYDHLPSEQRAKTPLLRDAVRGAMEAVVPELLGEDGVVFHAFAGERLETILRETLQVTSDEGRLREVLTQANAEANRYAVEHGVGPVKEAKARK